MSKPEENELKEKKVRKVNMKKVIKTVELVLFVLMLVLAFILSDKFAQIILATSIEMLTRIINIILVAIVVAVYFNKKK